MLWALQPSDRAFGKLRIRIFYQWNHVYSVCLNDSIVWQSYPEGSSYAKMDFEQFVLIRANILLGLNSNKCMIPPKGDAFFGSMDRLAGTNRLLVKLHTVNTPWNSLLSLGFPQIIVNINSSPFEVSGSFLRSWRLALKNYLLLADDQRFLWN